MPAARSLVPARLGRALLWILTAAGAFLLVVGALWVTLPDPAPLARENPRTTALIEQRKAEALEKKHRLRVQQSWVGLDRVSRRLVEAVVLSEDARFFGHDGLDWAAMRDAAKHDLAQGSFARGASTITQQLAKNLWFGTSKSLWRKLKEAVAAAKIEHSLSKRRVLALYLGVAEWGEGVFGVEAGARHRFGVSASQLTTAQAVLMASMLPAPRRVDLARPSSWLRRRALRLLDRMRDEGGLPNDEHLRASAELERILAGPAPAGDTGSEEVPEEDEGPAPKEPPAEAAPPVANEETPTPPVSEEKEGGGEVAPPAARTEPSVAAPSPSAP
jgi:monofunctional biosynthetic peptidoglycan transglycosylase